MIELKTAPYCENCPRFCAVTHMDVLKRAEIIHTKTIVTCEHADACSVMYDHLSKIQKEKKENA